MIILVLFPFVLACAVSDLKTRRIPNSLILCGLIGAVLFRLVPFPRTAGAAFILIAEAGTGFLLPWLFLGAPAFLKMIGGGDVKLLSVIGLGLGPQGCLQVMWHSLIFAAVWSVILVIRRRNFVQRFAYLYRYAGKAVTSGRLTPYRSDIHCNAGYDRSDSGCSGSCCSDSGCNTGYDRSGEFCLAVPILLALTIQLSFR